MRISAAYLVPYDFVWARGPYLCSRATRTRSTALTTQIPMASKIAPRWCSSEISMLPSTWAGAIRPAERPFSIARVLAINLLI